MQAYEKVGLIHGHDIAKVREEIALCPDGLLRDVLEGAWDEYLDKVGWPTAIARRITDMMKFSDDPDNELRDSVENAIQEAFSIVGQAVYGDIIGTEVIEESYFEDCEELGTL